MNYPNIKDLIDKDERTVYELAKLIGVHKVTLYDIYNGKTKDLKLSTAFKLWV